MMLNKLAGAILAALLVAAPVHLAPGQTNANETAQPDTARPDPISSDRPWPDDLTPGPFAVLDSGEVRFTRPGRDDQLPLRIRSPEPTPDRPGPFPLVVFSHGMGGDETAFAHLSEHLASHGYVVVHPVHTDSVRLQREAGASAQQIRKMFTREGTRRVDLESRVEDCLWIVQHIDEIEEAMGLVGRIDPTRAAMVGHSAGAMTTQALAGLTFFRPLSRKEQRLDDTELGTIETGDTETGDLRFDAFVVISGQGTTRRSITDKSWTRFTRPTLVFAGSADVVAVSRETPASRRHPFEHAPPGDKYLVFIDGATHSAYQGKAPRGKRGKANVKRIEALTSHATLAFLDLYLKNAQPARAWLTNDNPDKFKGVKADYRFK